MVISDNKIKYYDMLEKVYEDPAHPIENLRKIKLFLKKREHNGARNESVKQNGACLTVFSKWCFKPIEELDELDIWNILTTLKIIGMCAVGKNKLILLTQYMQTR